MGRKRLITRQVELEFLRLLRTGVRRREACEAVGIKLTSMSKHIQRCYQGKRLGDKRFATEYDKAKFDGDRARFRKMFPDDFDDDF